MNTIYKLYCKDENIKEFYYHKKKYTVEQIDNILEPKNLIKRYIMT